MKFNTIPLAVILAACMTAGAYGKTHNVNVRSGAQQQIWTHAVYIVSGCYIAAFPKVQLRQPANGKLTFKRKKIRVPKGRKCAGKTLNGVVVSYKSKRGFRGRDKGAAYFTFPAYAGEHVTKTNSVNFIINVK